jgi:hypothetical protein
MLTQGRLIDLIESPEVQRKILGDYSGGFSLGLTLNPEDRSQVVIRVRIEDDSATSIPHHIVLEGERVPIIVNTGYRVPSRLPAYVGSSAP